MKRRLFSLPLFSALCLCFAEPVCAQRFAYGPSRHRIKGNKNIVTRPVDTRPFDRIDVRSCIDVKYTQSTDGSTSVAVRGSDNLIDFVEVHVRDGRLIVDLQRNVSFESNGPLEVIASGPTLNEVSLNSSGDLVVENGLKTDRFAATLSGPGDLQLQDLQCTVCTLDLNSSGDIDADRIVCDEFEIVISGPGDATFAELRSGEGKILLQSSGDFACGKIDCGNLDCIQNGPGDLTIHTLTSTGTVRFEQSSSGDAELSRISCDDYFVTLSGPGDHRADALTCHNLTARAESSGDLTLRNIECSETVRATASGTSNTTLSGRTKDAEYRINNSGDLQADRLEARRVTVESSGLGNLRCHAEESISGFVDGLGTLYYSGKPQLTDLKGDPDQIVRR